jgi:hypothetical protein
METDAATGAGALIYLIIVFAVGVLVLAGMWLTFRKADKPGWAAIIPIYNIYMLLKVVGRPGWWLILFFIPLVDIIVGILVFVDLAKSFGKSTGFAVGIIFLSFIFIPILGFGDAKYVGPAAA